MRRDTKWDGPSALLIVAIAGLLAARIPLIGVRYFDPDEFEHSHAAWCVFKGLLPYKDFFEHHTPWYYYTLAPFFRWFAIGVDQSFDSARRFLLLARGLSWLLSALSVFLIYLVGRVGSTSARRVGLLGGVLLTGQSVVLHKTLEIRPDVLAMPFFLGGLWLLLRGLLDPEEEEGAAPRSLLWSLRWFWGGGLCLGAAVMCTQKMLFVLPGVFTGLGLWALGGRRRLSPARILAVVIALAGVAVPGLLTWAAFALHGGGGQFIQNNFLLNARWRFRSSRYVSDTLATAWPLAVLGAVGAVAALHRFYRARAPRPYGDLLLLCTLGGLLAGIVVIPVPYRQYYLMPLAIACVLAAKGLCFLAELAPQRARAWLLVGGAAPLLAWSAAELKRSFLYRDDGQMARLRFVFEHTAPADTVMDGWLGTGVFRPHADYFYFMHTELRVMLSDRDKDDYVDALESGKMWPALITMDRDLAGLGPRFVSFVRRNYATNDGLFYRPVRPRPVAMKTKIRFRSCPPAGGANTPVGEAAFRAAIARKWLSCHYTRVGGEDGDALGTQGDGLEIKPDGRYWHLARDAAGKLVGIPGVDSEGSVSYGVTGFGAVRLTFRSDLNQVLVGAPVITVNPTLLIIRTFNADHRYLAADGL